MNKINKDNALYKSIWTDYKNNEVYPSLNEDIETDVLVVGGGICGILCAYYLKNTSKKNVIVCEAKTIASGITKNTTAVITAQHDTMYTDLANDIGYEKAKKYLYANLDAVEEYKQLSKLYDFDFQEAYSCIYSSNKNTINKEVSLLNNMGYSAFKVDSIPLPIDMNTGVVFPKQGQMNPLKLVNELSKELKIYEKTKIIEIINNIAYTDHNNQITFKNIVICTHFPIVKNLMFSMRMYQKRSYVMAIDYKTTIRGTYNSDTDDGLYFRKYDNMLLIGGGDTRTGKRASRFYKVEKFIKDNLNDYDIKYIWANQDLVTLDNVPYIGKIKKNMYVATGFNLWGMSSSMVSAKLIADLIIGKENEYEQLFNPRRSILKKTLFINMKEFISSLLSKKEKKCTHLGCCLHYNKDEKSWDCPCHGSRFASDGEILNSPAKKDLE